MSIPVPSIFGKTGFSTNIVVSFSTDDIVNNVGDLVAVGLALGRQVSQSFIRQNLESRDRELAEGRDKSRYRCKGKQQTSIKTVAGVVEFRRNVYIDNAVSEGSKFVHLLDEDLELEAIGQIEREVCELAAELACEGSYRAAARMITEMTGMSISPQGVWNVVQAIGEHRGDQIERHAELVRRGSSVGSIETKLLYEENDGIWLKLQGRDRAEFGKSKEMKVGIAYDGATWELCNGGKKRRTLDGKVAHAAFESASEFRRNKEGIIASRYDVGKIDLRIINGDGANWIQKTGKSECICVLDEFHRNRKMIECIRDPEFFQTAKTLLNENRIDDLLACIEAQINSIVDEDEKKALRELLSYYKENKGAMTDPYSRGIEIPETREPGAIHHARLGSMESNVFTIIGNRMKGRRSCWSIRGANNLARLLCLKHTTGLEGLFTGLEPLPPKALAPEYAEKPFSASKAPKSAGSGTEFYHIASLPATQWIKNVTGFQSFTELRI